MHTTRRTNPLTVSLLALVVCAGGRYAAAETLDQAMARIAVQVRGEMRKVAADSVQVGRPDGPPGDFATLRMQQALVDALEAADVKVDSRAGFKLSTEYLRSPESDRYSMTVRLRDVNGQTIGALPANFRFTLTDPADRAVLAGSTVEPATDLTGKPQPSTIERIGAALAEESKVDLVAVEPNAVGKPGAVDEAVPDEERSLVGAHPGSRFRIELLSKPKDTPGEYLPRFVEVDGGRAFTKLEPGEVYAVRVVNDADHAVAVDLNIDGVNVWRLSRNEIWRRHGKFHVDAHGEATLYGWHLDGEDYGEFEVVDYPIGLAARLGEVPAQVGQVTALFYAAWTEGDVPFVEPIGAAGPKTDVGKRTRRTTETVRCFFGTSLLAAVTIRYDRTR